jgi:hypothetical protein
MRSVSFDAEWTLYEQVAVAAMDCQRLDVAKVRGSLITHLCASFDDGLLLSSCSLIGCNLICPLEIYFWGFGYHYLLMKLPLFMV